MNLEERVTCLRGVGFLSQLDEATLTEVAEHARVRHFSANQRIVSELEFGEDVYILARGQARISVSPRRGSHVVLGEIGPGTAFGEMASLTGELRSATVEALTAVQVLILADRFFDRLRARRPEIAVSLVQTLALRLVEAERTLAALLAGDATVPSNVATREGRNTLSVLWRELVVNHKKELPFLALVAFSATLVVIRFLVFIAFEYGLWPREILRAAYVSGFILVMLCACAAILTFRPKWRRIITLAFGVGAALIVNELGVTLAFDIFYKDTWTPDPNLTFDIERLYRRTEPVRAIVVGLTLLIQAVYLGTFYRRLGHRLKLRLLGILGRTLSAKERS